MNKIKEIAAYVRQNVEFFEERLQLALNKMDRMRCPLRMADSYLWNEICDAADDWSCDNNVNIEDVDLEDILWEE